MSEKDNKKKLLQAQTDQHTRLMREVSATTSRRVADSKKVRKINPLGMRVVVRIIREGNQTDAGLYLPEGAKQAMAESLAAEVLEVASAIDDHTDEETNVSGIPLGAIVLIPKDSGIKVPWDEDLRIVDTKNVLAIINEIDIT